MDKGKQRQEWSDEFAHLKEEYAAEAVAANQDILDHFEGVWKRDLADELEDTDFDLNDPAAWQSEFTRSLPHGTYQFEQDNPYLTHPNPIAEADAMKSSEHGNTSLQMLALALEAALQRDEWKDNASLWAELGQVQAENEKEVAAIRALEHAVELDPDYLPAYLSLAISYINEGYDHQAYQTLESWVRRKYPDLPIADGATLGMDARQRIVDAYLIAVRMMANGQLPMDADVQIGLGVLLYSGGEYDKAVDCFVAAVESRPNDHLLWNRLGATLANSGRSEEAISAYHRALDIKPNFVRGRYNLGVSCTNIGCHREAAEHLLSALALHGDSATSVNISSSLWETLRRTFYMMGRSDLAEKAVAGTSIDQFRGEFDF